MASALRSGELGAWDRVFGVPAPDPAGKLSTVSETRPKPRGPLLVIFFIYSAAHMQSLIPIAVPAAFILLATYLLLSGRLSSLVPLSLWTVLILMAYVTTSIILNDSTANLSLMRYVSDHGKLLYMLVTLTLVSLLKRNHVIVGAFLYSYLVAAAMAAGLALYSAIVNPIVIGEIHFSQGPTLQGPYGGRNPLAGMLGSASLIALHHFLTPEAERLIKRRGVMAAGVLTSLTLIVSQSRGYTLGFGVAALFGLLMAFRHDTARGHLRGRVVAAWVVAPVLVAGVVIALYGRLVGISSDPNVTTRISLWERASQVFLESPVFGVGLGAFQQVNLRLEEVVPGLVAIRKGGAFRDQVIQHSDEGGLHVHNVYLQALVDLGIVGSLLLASLVAVGWIRAGGRGFEGAQYRMQVVYLAVAGMTAGYTFTSPTTALVLFFLLGGLLRRPLDDVASSLGGLSKHRTIVPTGSGDIT